MVPASGKSYVDAYLRPDVCVGLVAGLPGSGAFLLQPCSGKAEVEVTRGPIRAMVLSLDMPLLAVQLSPAMLPAAQRVTAELSTAARQHYSWQSGEAPITASLEKQSGSAEPVVDDLRCGLFTACGTPDIRPGASSQLVSSFDALQHVE